VPRRSPNFWSKKVFVRNLTAEMCGSTVFPHLTNSGIGGGGGGSCAATSGGGVQGVARYIF